MDDFGLDLENPELTRLRLNKESGYTYRERREEDWRENYTLYRNRVEVNRLTQRQSVNIPLMKTQIRSLLKDIDDMPVIYLENLDNDKQKEVFKNTLWEDTLERNNAEVKDIMDKKQVLFNGRSFDVWQVVDGAISWQIVDAEDILVDRYCDPTDIDSTRFLIHTHIFMPLSKLEENELYDQQAVTEIKKFYATDMGLIKAADNLKSLEEKAQKMENMGLDDAFEPILGETYVELSLHFNRHKESEDEEEQFYLYVECDAMQVLMKEPLEKVIGDTTDHFWRTHLPYNSWADDIDLTDFWSDSVADIIRVPNIVLNSMYSQEVENRTLRNFGMNIYNSNIEGYEPQSYEPRPFGWYGVPLQEGQRMEDVYQKLEIPSLTDARNVMEFIITLTEKATGATATQQGAQTDRKVTLGEIELTLGEAKERVQGLAKFYLPVWKKRAEKFCKLVEASADKLDAVKVYKKGRNTDNIYSYEMTPKDWESESGYRVKIWSKTEKTEKDLKDIEMLNVVVANIPGNQKLTEIYQRKLLDVVEGLKPDEVNDIIEEERQKREMIAQAQNQLGMGQPGIMGEEPAPAAPVQPGQPMLSPGTQPALG